MKLFDLLDLITEAYKLTPTMKTPGRPARERLGRRTDIETREVLPVRPKKPEVHPTYTHHVDFEDDGKEDRLIQPNAGELKSYPHPDGTPTKVKKGKGYVMSHPPTVDEPDRSERPMVKDHKPTNSKEQHEIRAAGGQRMNPNFHIMYGGTLSNGDGKTHIPGDHKADYYGMLAAIKRRDDNTMSDAALARLYDDAATGIMHQLGHQTSSVLKSILADKAGKILLVPVPSSSNVPKEFADVLAKKLQGSGASVSVSSPNTLVKANLNFPIYADHKFIHDKGPQVGEGLTKEQMATVYGNLIHDVRHGRRTIQQAIDMLNDNKQHIWDTIDDHTEDEESRALEHVDVIGDMIHKLKTDESIAEDNARNHPNDSPRKYAKMDNQQRRNHVYGRMKATDKAHNSTIGDDVMVILVDDNVEEGTSIYDTYKALLKSGFVKTKDQVIGAVAHKLK